VSSASKKSWLRPVADHVNVTTALPTVAIRFVVPQELRLVGLAMTSIPLIEALSRTDTNCTAICPALSLMALELLDVGFEIPCRRAENIKKLVSTCAP